MLIKTKHTFTQIHKHTHWLTLKCQSGSGAMDRAGVRMLRDFPKAVKDAGCNGSDLTTCVQRKGLLLAKQHTCPLNTASILPHQLVSWMWLHPSSSFFPQQTSYNHPSLGSLNWPLVRERVRIPPSYSCFIRSRSALQRNTQLCRQLNVLQITSFNHPHLGLAKGFFLKAGCSVQH